MAKKKLTEVEELTARLRADPGHCPYCGSDDLEIDDWDGQLDVSCEVACGACGEQWRECYSFYAAFPSQRLR